MMPGATHIYLHAQSFQAPASPAGVLFFGSPSKWKGERVAPTLTYLQLDLRGAQDRAGEAVLVSLDQDDGAIAAVGGEFR